MFTKLTKEKIVSCWLLLGITAIGIAALYSIGLVLLSSIFFDDFMPYKDFFCSALIVHIDLSVLVWFFAIQSAVLSQYISDSYISIVVFILVAVGAAMLAVSPLYKAVPLINSYIPILQNFLFAFGLALFTCGILVSNIYFLYKFITSYNHTAINHQELYVFSSAIIALVAMACIYIAHYKLQQVFYLKYHGIEDYFERLFWGGGHILQFFYIQSMQFAWIVLYNRVTSTNLQVNWFVSMVALMNLLVVLPMLFVIVNAEIDSASYIIIFTEHRHYFVGISPTLLATYLIIKIIQNNHLRCCSFEFSILISSMLLFFIGGIISFFIDQNGAIITANYYGQIIGTAVALMGLSYVYLETLKFNFIKNKIVNLIPYLYFTGQLIYIVGLVISGGYGVLRKTPGEVFSVKVKMALGLMGFGELVALIGSLLFVYMCYSAFFCKLIKGNIR